MGNTGNELPHGGHFFALQQLLLCAPQVFIRPAGLFVKTDLLNGSRQLPSDCYQQVFIIAAVLPCFATADTHDADRIVLAPEKDPNPGVQAVATNEIGQW